MKPTNSKEAKIAAIIAKIVAARLTPDELTAVKEKAEEIIKRRK